MDAATITMLKRIEQALIALRTPPPRHGSGVPPWHMWGGSQVMSVRSQTSGVRTEATGQLSNIDYKRPETWHWILAARLLDWDGAELSVPGDILRITCNFDVNVAIGRTQLSLRQLTTGAPPNGFEQLQLRFEFPNPIQRGWVIWSTQSRAPNRASPDPFVGGTFDNITDQIVAQTIQVNTRVSIDATVGGGAVANTAQIELTSLFAPKTHIRPEWELHTFPGGEER